MKLTKYKNYKNTHIHWLGNIPQHWEVKRIKDLTSTKSGTTPTSNNNAYYENGIHNWIRTTDLNNGELFEVESKVTDIALDECRLTFLPINSVLVAMYGGFGTIGKHGILKKESTINQSVCAVLPNKKFLDSNYFLYFLKYFRYDWKLFADGTRKDPNINQDAVKNLFLFSPPLSEQTAIANYLDQKTAQIDKKVALLSQKIEKYKELKKTLINQTVCRGLDKNVKLIPSGIDWIGDIPEHWEVKRFKDCYDSCMGNTILQVDLIDNGKIPVYSATAEDKFFGYVNNANIILKQGDIVIPARGNSIGFVKYVKIKSTASQTTIVCRRKNNRVDTGFICNFLFAKKTTLFKFDNTAIPQFTVEDANFMKILIPPFTEQTAIAQYLDEKTNKIDQITANLSQQIEALKELRKTLINEVVTGKLRVID